MRSHSAFGTVLLFGVLAIAPPTLRTQKKFGGVAPKVSGMRAYLFQNKSGEWSEDVLSPTYRGSWNTIAGPKAANATLIVVEVAPGTSRKGSADVGARLRYSVRLVARELGESPKLLIDEKQLVPVLNDRGSAYLPFLLHQSGCVSVALSATVAGSQNGKALERTLIFACGE